MTNSDEEIDFGKDKSTKNYEASYAMHDFLKSFVLIPVKIAESFKEKFQRQNPDNVWYHRRYRRVPGIETCRTDDEACIFEANRQYLRDKKVEREIINIMKIKLIECHHYYHYTEHELRCSEIQQLMEEAETNYFIKYGDMGKWADVVQAFDKQKHRMIWERRHGEVGSGMQHDEPFSFIPHQIEKTRKFAPMRPYANFMGRVGIRMRDGTTPEARPMHTDAEAK